MGYLSTPIRAVGWSVAFIALMYAGTVALAPSVARAQASFTVNATGETGDANVGDGTCSTGARTPGGAAECTLQAAIEEANHDAAPDTIRFDTVPRDQSGAAVLSPTSPLTIEEEIVLDGTTAPTDVVVREGDLRNRIQAIRAQMPGADSEGFQVPTEEELEDWHTLMEFIRDEDIPAARSVIAQQFPSYTLVRFTDTVTDQVYWLLEESTPIERGWGAVVMNPTPDRNLIIEAPHPVFELNTESEGADLFRETGARALVLAGTHRCSNAAVSSCDGQTGVCGSFGPYRESDDAHVVDAPFQVTHTFFTDQHPDLTALSLHGHARSDCEAVFLSDGVSGETATAIEDLQAALDQRGVEVGIPGNSSCPLEGTTNVQGRYTNGATAPCTEDASSTSGQFVHIEQSSGFRDSPETYAPLIEAVQEVYPLLSNETTSPPRLQNEGVSEEPVLGIDGGDLPSGSSGLVLEGPGADGSTVQGVAVFNAPKHGLRADAPNVTVQDVHVGLRPNGEGAGNGHSPGTGASVGALRVTGDGFSILGNIVSGNQSEGIHASGQDGLLRDNVVGADADLQVEIPNAGTGIRVEGDATIVRANVVFGNEQGGIVVTGEGGVTLGYGPEATLPDMPSVIGGGEGNAIIQNDGVGLRLDNTKGTAVRGNRVYGNGEGGLRLADPYDGNDAGDTDEGVNRGQNYPVDVSPSNCDDDGSPTTVDVSYRVRSNADSASASNYGGSGLAVDFYTTDPGERQGKTYLGTDRYTAPDAGTLVSTSLDAGDASCTDKLVAAVTDADGNTSQFTPTPTTLPVELIFFRGKQSGTQSVLLQWQTATETDNAGFEVQRRAADRDGAAWMTLNFVESKAPDGAIEEPLSYRFEDEELPFAADRLEYRLRQVDASGAVEATAPIVISRSVEELELQTVSPNPVRSQLRVRLTVPGRHPGQLGIYDVLGRRVRTVEQGTLEGREQLGVDVSGLSSGTYFLRAQAGGQSVIERFRVVR